MKTSFLKILFFLLAFSPSLFARTTQPASMPAKRDTFDTTPLFQLSAGFVYSCIDLTRYTEGVSYRGIHARLVTHLGKVFFLSTEYSTFPVHTNAPAWEDVHTRKFDINGHISFATNNHLTRVYVFTGINRHEWTAKYTGMIDLKNTAAGLEKGASASVQRWGANFGCGLTQTLYENIGIFADCRFCVTNMPDAQKIRFMDVMTTIGINLNIPYPVRNNGSGKKSFGIGKKVYKWTEKGAK